MYGYEWTSSNGIYRLIPNAKIIKEVRPVFKEELDFFGFSEFWEYPETQDPLLWAEGIRRYVLNGEVVAEATGGGFYTKPRIDMRRTNIKLEPINISELWDENENLMLGLEEASISFIRQVHEKYIRRRMQFVVAFSVGKDSLVLLDLVAKALRPDEFVVIFANTDMELNATLKSFERAKSHWNRLRFYEASSHLSADDSWNLFGPPGRRLRWCCTVHKSVPTVLKLREIAGDRDARVVVFDGVRKEESNSRSMYDAIGEGVKNSSQVNVSPILEWGTSEIYLYLLKNNLLFNDAYRFGLFRVGCKICPLSSSWWDGIAGEVYGDELGGLLKKVEEYSANTKIAKERRAYVAQGGWKGRMGGRGLPCGGNRGTEVIDDDQIRFLFSHKTQNWLETCKIVGKIVGKVGDSYVQLIGHQSYELTITPTSVTYSPYSAMDRVIVSRLRGVANKVAYCVGCKACVVQCPAGAFDITGEGRIAIREDRCTHCGHCIGFTGTKGCLAAKSLFTTGGYGMDLKGMNRYQHFGFRREWLEHFFEYGTSCFTRGELGNRQYDALKVWLRESELMTPAGRGEKSGVPTELFKKVQHLSPGNPLLWAVIWTNLAYNSVIIKWYMLYATAGRVYDKAELVFMLGDDYAPSTRDNAVTSLLETLRLSPVGAVLKQGIPIPDGSSFRYSKVGWEAPNAIAILYSLYKLAQESGRYTFTLSGLASLRTTPKAKGVDPVSIFGLDPDRFRNVVQDVALHYPEYLRVAFVQDLDNVVLVPEISALDILDLITE